MRLQFVVMVLTRVVVMGLLLVIICGLLMLRLRLCSLLMRIGLDWLD